MRVVYDPWESTAGTLTMYPRQFFVYIVDTITVVYGSDYTSYTC
jgi:hypothetical protein